MDLDITCFSCKGDKKRVKVNSEHLSVSSNARNIVNIPCPDCNRKMTLIVKKEFAEGVKGLNAETVISPEPESCLTDSEA